MTRPIRSALLCCLLGFALPLEPQAEEIEPEQCLECHDYGEDSPVHQVLAGSHGMADPGEGIGQDACLNCHGDSAAHLKAPRRNAPDVSFGPRWSATSGDQDKVCLDCHEDNVATNWRHALHMHNELTCVTCHDIHVEHDTVLNERQQAEVCTTCHKVQKQGIHGMQRRARRNPACSYCHNPHDHESAQAMMLANRSAGCVTCHDLARMATSNRVSAKAKSYHKVMTNPDRTCLDCHEGVAHADPESAPPIHPSPVRGRTVTLFYPGLTDSLWLTRDHPGSQPLRQGTGCQRCHRGEEAELGAALAPEGVQASRDLGLAFARTDDALEVTLTWDGPAEDAQLSLMWGGQNLDSFQRGGCFAACHNDMAGMTGDRGGVEGKYLLEARSQQQQVGRPAMFLDSTALEQLVADGKTAEIWQANLAQGDGRTGSVLADLQWHPEKLTDIKISREGNQWNVAFIRRLDNTKKAFRFSEMQRYTLGIALHGAGNDGPAHWVSLPMSLSFGGDDTDFTAEQQ